MSLFYCLDLSLALFTLYLSHWLHQHFPYTQSASPYSSSLEWQTFLAVALVWGISFLVFPIYTSKRSTSITGELTTVAGAVAFSWTIFTAWFLVFNYDERMRLPVVYFGVLSLLILLGFHLCLRVFLRLLRSRGYNHKRVLIVGAGPVGQIVAQALQDHPWAGFSIIGFLDDEPTLQGDTLLSIPVCGGLDKARAIVLTMDKDDEVIVALPISAHQRMKAIIHAIEDIPVNVRVVPDLFGIASVRPVVEDLWGIPLIGIRQPAIRGANAFFKRVMDITGALLGILLSAPLTPIVAILIKLDSKGPVFFVQERVGENGETFRMFKFRTMVENAQDLLDDLIDIDNLDEPVFKLKKDPRTTRIGYFLRRSSIDELPQLLNVLRGEMSLVGPRPEETRMVQHYNSRHRKRLMAKPGITGPVQVNIRGDLSLTARVELEIEYIRNFSIWQDVRILVKTILAVIQGDGIY